MAYFNQERKKALSPAIKALCKEYGVTVTFGVDHYSTFVINLRGGELDLMSDIKNMCSYDVEHHNISHTRVENFTGRNREFVTKLQQLANIGNHNNSDLMTDYFDVGWYVDIHVGRFQKPYICTKEIA